MELSLPRSPINKAQAGDGATGDHEVHMDGTSGDHEAHPEGVSKGNAALESDQLYDAAFAPYLTPEQTPPPPAALLAAAIRGSAPEQYVRAAFSATTAPDAEGSTPRSIKARHGPWEAAFNAGRLATVEGGDPSVRDSCSGSGKKKKNQKGM